MLDIYSGLTIAEVQDTLQKIRSYVLRTPLIRATHLEDILSMEVYFKLEYLQPTRSFKVRGACSKAISLNEKVLDGLVTASGGNMGLGVCYAGKQFGTPAIVYLPENSSQEKIDLIKFWGGNPVLYGEAWDEANIEAQEYAEKLKLAYIHPFDDIAVVRGQGTIALEMLEQNPFLEAIVVSVGGGGLISGIGMVAKQMKPEIKIFGVETVGCDAVTQSFRTGRLVTLPAITSIAKTLGAKMTTEITLARIKAVVDDMQTVTDQEALEALKFLLEKEKILVEPAASCSVAALIHEKFDLEGITKIGIVLCGANVSMSELKEWKVI